MADILITGGAGSIGRALVQILSAEGHAVRVMDLPSCDFAFAEELPGVQVVRGDILDRALLSAAAAGVDVVLHLAALLPPLSERDRQATWRVNVEGTRALIAALREGGGRGHLVLSSSVCVYGDTSAGDHPPISTEHPCAPFDVYGESKVAAEEAVRESGLPFTILRISGVSVPAFLAPPDVWPFRADQRIEFVARDDVVAALAACVDNDKVIGRTLHVAGGATWRMLGQEYVARFNEVMGLDVQDAVYCPGPCAFDWYETTEAQQTLAYQKTTFAAFLQQLEAAIEEALGSSSS
ncbi:MAG: NAD(P)-dependent oxidoreductase [Chloroflexi bacterium]|nr:NAD(P)-dependent oxidoreductase [Chloroflexota bacterium]